MGTIYIWLCTENIYILQLSILSLNAQVDSNFFHQFRSDPDFIYEYIYKSFVEYYFILENIQIIFGIQFYIQIYTNHLWKMISNHILYTNIYKSSLEYNFISEYIQIIFGILFQIKSYEYLQIINKFYILIYTNHLWNIISNLM